MISSKIENIIIKYLTKTATASDLKTLINWLKVPSNELLFKDYIQTHYAINFSVNDPDTSQLKALLLKEIRKDNNIFYKYNLRSKFKYAAIVVVLLGIGRFFKQEFFSNQPQFVVEEEKITLKLENGFIEVIDDEGQKMITDSKGDKIGNQIGNQLNYLNNEESEIGDLKYNELYVPYGKVFNLTLSDGTIVNLNSGSTIKFPVRFLKEGSRKVFLKGEAFFVVAHNTAQPFIVNTNKLDTKVLGTQFNISAYTEDDSIDVVLVEGSVSLNSLSEYKNVSDTQKITLKPGVKGSLNKEDNNISTELVTTSIYTSWIKGELVFRDMTFGNILKKLERRYNVNISCDNVALIQEKFNASFKEETIESVLDYFQHAYNIEYRIEANKIIIH